MYNILYFLTDYWYVAIITALSGVLAPLTSYRWAPLTCITLILFIPEFDILHYPIFAIVIT